jgi:hypothetical protein
MSVMARFRQSSLLDCHDNLDCERFTACPHDLANKNPARDFGGRLGNLALLDAFRQGHPNHQASVEENTRNTKLDQSL